MSAPELDLAAHLDDLEFVAWRGLRIDVEHLYFTLTPLGWKVDTEESNLMKSMSRTYRDEGIKVWLDLQKFVCAPPPGEVEQLDTICFYRFDPEQMPTKAMHEATYDPGDEEEDWYPSHREEWDWLIEHGDPQTDTFDLLTKIPMREVPPRIVKEVWAQIASGIRVVDG
ncbi:MAG: hypothetical protein R3B70_39565 [Polyangiaceae bacterium]